MSRYNNTGITFDKNEKRRLASTILSNISTAVTDVYIQITSADRLDKIANKFYNDATLWWIIAAANPSLRRGSIVVPPNIILRIPNPSLVPIIIQNPEVIR